LHPRKENRKTLKKEHFIRKSFGGAEYRRTENLKSIKRDEI
jgi:hypothetical protein